MLDTTTTQSAAPEEHSDLVGGSSAGKRIACPGSYQMEKKLPPVVEEASSDYADEGSACHAAMADILMNDIDDLTTLLGKTYEGYEAFPITQELLDEAIGPAIDWFDELDELFEQEGGLEFVVEKQCQMPGIPGAFGTSDLIGRTDKRSVIIDWKFGAGVPVYAEYIVTNGDQDGVKQPNDQPMFYARAAMHSYPMLFEKDADWPVDLFIAQPRYRDGLYTRHSTTVGKLEEWRYKLIRAIAEAKGENPSIRRGDHCRFARCKAICPHFTGPALDLTKMHAAIAHKDGPPPVSWSETYRTALELVEIVEPLCREVRAQAHTYLEDGGAIPGWKLVPKKAGHDAWEDDDKAEKYLGRQGIPLDERRVVKPITPAVARKKLKALGKELKESYVRKGVSSGTTLAPEDDSREAVIPTSQVIAGLAEKIARLQ